MNQSQNPQPPRRPPITLVADGSCDAVSEFGTWAAVVVTPSARRVFYGMAYPTTISRCELTPILEGLRWIRANTLDMQKGVRVRVVSDSEFTVQILGGLNEAKKNRDLWAAVREASSGIRVEAAWRSRNSHPLMELCDSVAHALREALYGDKEVHRSIRSTAETCLNSISEEEVNKI